MRKAARIFSGPIMTVAGLLHFVTPRTYERIMPPYLPAHRELVYASGVAETAMGIGAMIPATRRPAGWLGVATLIAIFPANYHLSQHPELVPELPDWAKVGFKLKYRLPLQLWMIWAVWTNAQRTETA